MQVTIQLFIINCLVFNFGVTFIAGDKKFLEPCQNHTIPKPINATNCKLFVVGNATKRQLKNIILDPKAKIIHLDINIPKNVSNDPVDRHLKNKHSKIYLYRPFKWQMVRFDVGQNLLPLSLQLKLLNLTAINIGFRSLNIDLRSEPPSCVNKLSYPDFCYLIREMFLGYIKDSPVRSRKELSLCNQVIIENDGIANFQTICYTHTPDKERTCHFLKQTNGWKNLLIFRDIIFVITLLFGPFLIPRRLYTLMCRQYLFYLPKQLPVKLMISENKENNSSLKVYNFPIERYPSLKTICPDRHVMYEGKLIALALDADDRKILPRTSAGINFSRVLYNKLFRCKYRSGEMQKCLSSQIFPLYFQHLKNITWRHFGRWFMRVVLFLLLISPWILRLLLYYKYEHEDIMYRDKAIKSLHLKLSFRSSILNYIQPLHGLFLFIYAVYFINLISLGIFDCVKKNKLSDIIKEALRCMRERAKLENITFHVGFFFYTLKRYGLLGLLLAPFFWIFAVPLLVLWNIFYIVPVVRLIVCLLQDLVISTCPSLSQKMGLVDEKPLSIQERFNNFIVTLLFLLTVISASILITECINYFVTVLFSVFIILILKADITLPYLSLGFLIIFYLFGAIHSVETEFNDFKKNITDKLIEEMSGINNDKSNTDPSKPESTAHATDESLVGFTKRNDRLILESHSLLLFVDSRHRPYIPEKFFLDICHLPYKDFPGSITLSYLRALKKFSIILVFLGFVLIVTQTFFGLYHVSSTNQTLATLVGGFIPLFVQKMISMNVKIPEVDMETLAFKRLFRKAVKEYTEEWTVSDIIIDLQENQHSDDSTNYMYIYLQPETLKP